MKERSASKKREKAKFELLRNGNFLFIGTGVWRCPNKSKYIRQIVEPGNVRKDQWNMDFKMVCANGHAQWS